MYQDLSEEDYNDDWSIEAIDGDCLGQDDRDRDVQSEEEEDVNDDWSIEAIDGDCLGQDDRDRDVQSEEEEDVNDDWNLEAIDGDSLSQDDRDRNVQSEEEDANDDWNLEAIDGDGLSQDDRDRNFQSEEEEANDDWNLEAIDGDGLSQDDRDRNFQSEEEDANDDWNLKAIDGDGLNQDDKDRDFLSQEDDEGKEEWGGADCIGYVAPSPSSFVTPLNQGEHQRGEETGGGHPIRQAGLERIFRVFRFRRGDKFYTQSVSGFRSTEYASTGEYFLAQAAKAAMERRIRLGDLNNNQVAVSSYQEEEVRPLPQRFFVQFGRLQDFQSEDNGARIPKTSPVFCPRRPKYDMDMMTMVKTVAESFGIGVVGSKPDCCSEQLKEYIKLLKEMEKTRRVYFGKSGQLINRESVMGFISKVCRIEDYNIATMVHAFYLYDRFADWNIIADIQIYLVALTCLLISAKLEENDWKTTKMKEIARHIPKETDADLKSFVTMESVVLQYFNFKVTVPTEVNFIDVFILFAMDGYGTEDFYRLYKSECKKAYEGREEHMLYDIVYGTQQLLSIVGHMSPCPVTSPSLSAAAILMCARRECHMNFWTTKLETVTGYSYEDVVHCLKNVIEPRVDCFNGRVIYSIRNRVVPAKINF